MGDVLEQHGEEMKRGYDWQDGGESNTVEGEREAEADKERAKRRQKETQLVLYNQLYSSRLTQGI